MPTFTPPVEMVLSRTLLHATVSGPAESGHELRPAPTSAALTGARPLRVLIAGGGTGGHLFPGVALAEEVRARGGEVLFVGTARGIEARVLPEQGWPLQLIDATGIKGRGIKGLLAGLLRLPRAWWQSLQIVRRFRPDVVVGVGGYASGPVVATAAMNGKMASPSSSLSRWISSEAADTIASAWRLALHCARITACAAARSAGRMGGPLFTSQDKHNPTLS